MSLYRDGWGWLRDLLRRRGLSQDEVELEIHRQKAWIAANFTSELDVLMFKAHSMGFGCVDLDRVEPSREAVQIAPAELVRFHQIAPVKKDGTNLYVAMSNPSNIVAIDAIKMASGLRVIPVVAVQGALEDAIRKYYPGGGSGGGDTAPAPTAAAATPAVAPGQGIADIRNAIALAGASRRTEEDTDPDADAEKMAEQAPIIKLANALIQQAIIDRASDIHVEPQQRAVRVRYRIDGVLQEAMAVPRNLMAPLISRFKIMADMNIAERRAPQDGRIEVRNAGKEYDLRVSSIPTPFGEKIVMRILDKSSTMVGLNKIGFTEENQIKVEELTAQPNGMFLCTGPTGSGKTTTLYSVLHKLNTVGVNIVTAEDPIEYQIGGIAQVQMNRKANLTFATALRAFLRQDPDIIMVGEIRDLETAEIAVEAALTGHLVLSTLHTNDAPSATLRLGDMGVEPYLISATLIGVLAQRLGRKIDPDSREPYEVPATDLRRFGFVPDDADQMVTLWRGVPSEGNRMTGYKGRTGFHELMLFNSEIAELVVRRAPLHDIKEAAKANGMRELREDGLGKVLAGITDPGEVMRVVFTAGF